MNRPKKPLFVFSFAIPLLVFQLMAGIGFNFLPLSTVLHAEETNEGKPILVSLGVREVTAYNPIRGQTDGDPCIGALPGINFCTTTEKIVALRDPEISLGEKVFIDCLEGEYLVGDRTSEQYEGRVDILVNVHNTPPHIGTMEEAVKEAKRIGYQKCEVFLVKE